MKIAVHAKIHEFVIKHEEGDIIVGVREAREAELEHRYELFKKREQVVIEGGREVAYRQSLNLYTLRGRELWLSLAYVKGIIDDKTNAELFRHSTDKRGSLRISSAMTEPDFLEALALLPQSIVNELSNFSHKVNPAWGEYIEPEADVEEQKIPAENSDDATAE